MTPICGQDILGLAIYDLLPTIKVRNNAPQTSRREIICDLRQRREFIQGQFQFIVLVLLYFKTRIVQKLQLYFCPKS